MVMAVTVGVIVVPAIVVVPVAVVMVMPMTMPPVVVAVVVGVISWMSHRRSCKHHTGRCSDRQQPATYQVRHEIGSVRFGRDLVGESAASHELGMNALVNSLKLFN
jgi:hypothetical protein